ncbi:MAG: acyltransferase [Polyangiaceae bacterium]
MKRIRQLDGLRAFAFLAVYLNHSIYVPMAWVGVDLFFVLSGFLITNILLAAKAQPARQFYGSFYARRARRILPPYFMVLVAVAILVPAGIQWSSVWWQFLLFAQNFSVAFQLGVGVLNPYWSLAVEEQFYLLWPLLVYFLPREHLKSACVFFLVAAPLARCVATPRTESYLVVFTLTPFRMDLLGAGSLLAVFWAEDHTRVKRWLGWAWAVMIGSAMMFFLPALRFTWWRANANSLTFNVVGYSLGALLFTSMLIVVLATSNKALLSLLRSRALVWIGSVSYMAYLVHEPVLHFVMPVFGRVGGTVVGLAATLLLAGMSWRFVESPILRNREQLPSR